MEDKKFIETLENLGVTKQKIDDICKKKKSAERIKYVLEKANVQKKDPELALMLIQLAEKLNPAYNHRLDLLLKFVLPKEISTVQQLDAAVAYIRKKGEEVIDEEDFKNKCGCGIKISEKEVREEVKKLINSKQEEIKILRYKFQHVNILLEIMKKYEFLDKKSTKNIVEEEMAAFIGEKNQDEIEEEKLRKELGDLNDRKKKEKKKFPENDKKKIEELKEKLKKYDLIAKENEKKIAELKEQKEKTIKKEDEKTNEKQETDKKEEEEIIDENDKLKKLMARDMKSSLNPPDILKKHLEFTKGKVFTRFPPEPNGYLHLGHAKAARFCFNSAAQVGGHCYLRLDDTNPEKESLEFIESIKENIHWLGYTPYKVTFASDYLDDLYNIAVKLIKKGLAYVDDLPKEEMAKLREEKRDSPYRNRTVEENLDLFEKMRQGRFEEKECCLRLKIDNKHKNTVMRDPVAYRVKYVPHPHAGDKWCIYPTYDFTHCLNDSLENITHSLCTLEFEIRRDSYYWLLEAAEMYRPFVWEYSRLNVGHVVVSKRKLLQLVTSHSVTGWNDPRMPTIDGLRRRGYTPEAINSFVDKVGVTRRGNENRVPYSWLEDEIKNDLNTKAPRTLAVIEPLKVTLNNVKEKKILDSYLFPKEKEQGGIRKLNLTPVIYIEKSDFKEKADKDFYGLTQDQEVGLKYGGYIKLVEVKKNKEGEVIELVCSYHEENKKLKGRIHWISSEDYVYAELRLYGYLFLSDDPFNNPEKDPMKDLNPKSLVTKMDSMVNKDIVKELKHLDHFQFERIGYFVCDYDTDVKKERYVFNLTVGLGDGKVEKIMGVEVENKK